MGRSLTSQSKKGRPKSTTSESSALAIIHSNPESKSTVRVAPTYVYLNITTEGCNNKPCCRSYRVLLQYAWLYQISVN